MAAATSLEERFNQHWPKILEAVEDLLLSDWVVHVLGDDDDPPVAGGDRLAGPERWKGAVRAAAEEVARADTEFTSPGAKKEKLDRVSKAARALELATKGLPAELKTQLGIDAAFLDKLTEIRTESGKLIDSTKVEPSGGSPRKRTDRKLKELAAELAFRLLYDGLLSVPTSTAGGPWLVLTEQLFRIATGRRPGELRHACEDQMEVLFDDYREHHRRWRRDISPRELAEDEAELAGLSVDEFLADHEERKEKLTAWLLKERHGG